MIFIAFIFGALIGSFLSVCIYRLPLKIDFEEEFGSDEDESSQAGLPEIDVTPPSEQDKDISICSPSRSFCPSCKHTLPWKYNIPVVSWLMLRGKCGFCESKIPFRYFLLEVLTGLVAALTVAFYGLTTSALVVFAFVCALIVITFIDYDYYIIPNAITYPGTVIGLGCAVLNQFTGVFHTPYSPIAPDLTASVLGILMGGGFLYLVSEVYFRLRKLEGLGMGDVKLLTMTGAFFGWQCAFFTIFVGSLLGSVVGVALVIFARRKLTQALPFGPFLACATVVYLYVQHDFIAEWAGFFMKLYG